MNTTARRASIKYLNGTFVSEGDTVPTMLIRERDRRMLKENPGKAFPIGILEVGMTRKRFSPHKPRKHI